MKPNKLRLALMLSFPLALSSAGAIAAVNSELDKATAIESTTTKASVKSQHKIDVSADKTLAMKAEMERLQQEVENLTLYRDHLVNLVDHQQQEVASLDDQINQINQTRQGVVPLMYRMIDSLALWVEQDMPIKPEHRKQRVEKLMAMMGRADVSDAEKFRRILEAYQVELDYGTKLGAYQGSIIIDGATPNDRKAREVDVLHLGRVSLVARSLDDSRYWYWNTPDQSWQTVDSAAGKDIDSAFSMAEKQITPALLSMPLSIVQKQSPSGQENAQAEAGQ